MKLTEVGWLYMQVKNFCDWGSGGSKGDQQMDRAAGGLVNQSLIMALRDELNEYCRLIAVLESQVS